MIPVHDHDYRRRTGQLTFAVGYNPNRCWADVKKAWGFSQCNNPDPGGDLGLCDECRGALRP